MSTGICFGSVTVVGKHRTCIHLKFRTPEFDDDNFVAAVAFSAVTTPISSKGYCQSVKSGKYLFLYE